MYWRQRNYGLDMYEVVLRSEMCIYACNVCKENSDNNKDNNDNKQQTSPFQKRQKTCTQKRICLL